MSRRLLLPLLAALALLLAAAPAALATAGPAAVGGPSARIAQDGADDPATDAPEGTAPEDDGCVEDDDGALVCDDGWAAGGDDDADVELCDDGPAGDEDLSDDADDADAEIAADDDSCDDGTDAAATAPRVSALHATVAGAGRRARVRVGFRLDRAGKVRLTLERVEAAASRAAKRCAARAGQRSGKVAKAGRKGCGAALRGSVEVGGHGGVNSTALPRRWNGRPLGPGSYRLTVAPVARGGASATTTFTLAAAANR